MEKQYKWKLGFFSQADAQKVGEELEEMQTVNVENILDKARNEDTELHKVFEWNNEVAGEKWRRHQASQMLQELQVVIIKGDEENKPKTAKAFVTLKRETEYEPIEAVVNDPLKYESLREIALNKIRKIRQDYAEVESLKDSFKDSKALNTGIGYKEFIPYFSKEKSLDEVRENIKKNSRHYAKRQYTFFNHQFNVKWFKTDYDDFDKTINKVINYIDKM